MDNKVITGLSGDETAFLTEGKSFCRNAWYEHTNSLYKQANRKLNFLWLANNQLTDIDPILDKAQFIYVPDNNKMNHAAKRKTLVYKYNRPKKNDFIRVSYSFDDLNEYEKLDIINLDTCNHLDFDTLGNINALLAWRLQSKCLFFATFSKHCGRSIIGERFPEYRRISGNLEEISEILTDTFKIYSYNFKTLPLFPITYETGNVRKGHMYSFGWELTKK